MFRASACCCESESTGVAEAVENIFCALRRIHDGEAAETLIQIETRLVPGARIHAVADSVFGEFDCLRKFFSGERPA